MKKNTTKHKNLFSDQFEFEDFGENENQLEESCYLGLQKIYPPSII